MGLTSSNFLDERRDESIWLSEFHKIHNRLPFQTARVDQRVYGEKRLLSDTRPLFAQEKSFDLKSN